MSNELKIETLGPIEADERAIKYEEIRAWQAEQITGAFQIPFRYWTVEGYADTYKELMFMSKDDKGKVMTEMRKGRGIEDPIRYSPHEVRRAVDIVLKYKRAEADEIASSTDTAFNKYIQEVNDGRKTTNL